MKDNITVKMHITSYKNIVGCNFLTNYNVSNSLSKALKGLTLNYSFSIILAIRCKNLLILKIPDDDDIFVELILFLDLFPH